LPTAGGSKIECPERSEGLFLAPLGTLNFVIAYGGQNWRTALHSGKNFAVSPFDKFDRLTASKLRASPRLIEDSSLFASRAFPFD